MSSLRRKWIIVPFSQTREREGASRPPRWQPQGLVCCSRAGGLNNSSQSSVETHAYAAIHQAEPPDTHVDVEDPRELPETPDGLHPHDYEGPEDSNGLLGGLLGPKVW